MAIGTKRIEDYIPVVKYNEGLYTELDLTVATGANVILPSTTTIGGSAVVALGDITSSSTTATAFSVTNTGVFTGTSVIDFTADSLTTGDLLVISAAGATTGTIISVASAEANLTSGLYLDLGAQFTVGAKGLTTIAGDAAGTSALVITAGDLEMTSGNAVLTAGDLTLTDGDIILTAAASMISFTGTGANGGVLKNLKNAAASSLSGTQLDIEIDIGGVPYYFTVYPTKA